MLCVYHCHLSACRCLVTTHPFIHPIFLKVDDNAVAEAERVAINTEGVIGIGQVRARRTGATTLVDLRVDISPHLPASAAAQVCNA
jgi:divalent metal cation (Fe/Co/Zn/Cd) transporter